MASTTNIANSSTSAGPSTCALSQHIILVGFATLPVWLSRHAPNLEKLQLTAALPGVLAKRCSSLANNAAQPEQTGIK